MRDLTLAYFQIQSPTFAHQTMVVVKKKILEKQEELNEILMILGKFII